MRTLIFIAALLCLNGTVFAQTVSLKGVITDENKSGLSYANILLKQQNDSALVKGEVSDADGNFEFSAVLPGIYLLQIQYVGFSSQFFPVGVTGDQKEIDLGMISLKANEQELDAMVITAEKPFIEREADKMVVNIENSIVQKGTSLMEIMEKLPGVIIDQDGRIMMRGKQGVVIMIDNKPTPLAGQDLVNFLRSMPSSNVQKVEIISNPSAKYDAAGNAGIINVVTKKNKAEGYNGTVTLAYGQGRYAKYNEAVSFNYRKNKFSLYFNYAYSNRKGFNHLILNRKFYNADTLVRVFDNNNYLTFPVQMHMPRLGLDYRLNDKTTFSLLTSGISNPFSSKTNSISEVHGPGNEPVGVYSFGSETKEVFNDYEINAKLDQQLDTSGQSITINMDYGKYWSNSDQNLQTVFYDAQTGNDEVSTWYVKQIGDLYLYSGKIDYVKPMKRDRMFESGIKSSLVKSDQDMQYYDVYSASKDFDSNRSSHFIYRENINAAYVNFRKNFKKIMLQFGLRGEQTVAQGEQKLNGRTFTRNYAQIFPTLFIDYNPNESHNFNFNVGRRIDRPNYMSMNPMRQWIDANTYGEGNPYLLPQLTYLFEMNYGFKNQLFIGLNYNLTTNNIMDVLIQDAATQTTNQTIVNIKQNQYVSLSATYSAKITKWWRSNSTVMSYYSKFTGTVNNYNFSQGKPTLYLRTTNNFTINDKISAECSFNYMHKNLYGVTTMYATHNLTAGIQSKVLKDKGTLTLNCTDIFWHAWPRGLTEFNTVSEKWGARRDTRVVNINFTYKFGKGQTGRARRETGAEEEKGRIR